MPEKILLQIRLDFRFPYGFDPRSQCGHHEEGKSQIVILVVNPAIHLPQDFHEAGGGEPQFVLVDFQQLVFRRQLQESESPAHGEIEMDGGIGPANIAMVAQSGVGIAVAGSEVYRQPDPAAAIRALRARVGAVA